MQFLEATGQFVFSREIRGSPSGTVRVAYIHRSAPSFYTVEVRSSRQEFSYEELSTKAWTVLICEHYVPLEVDLDTDRAISEPPHASFYARAQADVPLQPKSPELRERTEDEYERFWRICAPTSSIGDDFGGGFDFLSKATDASSEEKILVEAMWHSGLIAKGCDIGWARRSFLSSLFAALKIDNMRHDDPFVIRLATTILIRIGLFTGRSPVIAVGESGPLREYIRDGMRKYLWAQKHIRQGCLSKCAPQPTRKLAANNAYQSADHGCCFELVRAFPESATKTFSHPLGVEKRQFANKTNIMDFICAEPTSAIIEKPNMVVAREALWSHATTKCARLEMGLSMMLREMRAVRHGKYL